MIYLLGEMTILLLLAFALGLVVSWLFLRWRQDTVSQGDYQKVIAERDNLRQASGRTFTPTVNQPESAVGASNESAQEFSFQPLNPARRTSRDDLTKIEGITPGIEKLLNEKGVTSYREIGSMNDAGVDSMFKNLAERPYNLDSKDFLDQARRLYNQKSANQAQGS